MCDGEEEEEGLLEIRGGMQNGSDLTSRNLASRFFIRARVEVQRLRGALIICRAPFFGVSDACRKGKEMVQIKTFSCTGVKSPCLSRRLRPCCWWRLDGALQVNKEIILLQQEMRCDATDPGSAVKVMYVLWMLIYKTHP